MKIYQFKARDSEINAFRLCLGNIAKDFSVDKKTIWVPVWFLVYYDSIVVYDYILDIQTYLMNKHDTK